MVDAGRRHERLTLPDACRELVGTELSHKARAIRTVLSRIAAEPWVSDLMRLLDPYGLDVSIPTQRLVELAGRVLSPGTDEPVEVGRLRWEAAGYLYYSSTLLEVFDDRLTRDRFEVASEPAWGVGSFDALARVLQTFATNARLAWLALEDFRQAWGLPMVQRPDR